MAMRVPALTDNSATLRYGRAVIATNSSNFTEHSAIPDTKIYRLERQLRTLRMSDARCTIINHRRSRNDNKYRVGGKAPGNDQARHGSFSVVRWQLQSRANRAVRRFA